MTAMTEKSYISYQAVYGFIFNLLTQTFDDWPLAVPPNLIVLHRHDKAPNLDDPRGPITLGEMCTGYCPPIGNMAAFPYWSVIRMFHPGVMDAIRLHFNSELTALGATWFIAGSITHELMHYLIATVKYLRMNGCNNENRWFASDLYERHILHRLGTMPDEYYTERLTIQALMAISLGRTHLSVSNLLAEALFLPKPNGNFFHSYTNSLYDTDATSSACQAALNLQYRYSTMNAAFGDPALHDLYIDEHGEVIRKLVSSARLHHEKCGKTWKVYDMTTSERSKWLT